MERYLLLRRGILPRVDKMVKANSPHLPHSVPILGGKNKERGTNLDEMKGTIYHLAYLALFSDCPLFVERGSNTETFGKQGGGLLRCLKSLKSLSFVTFYRVELS